MVFTTMMRFANLISRGYLLIYIFVVPIFLLFFRNSEIISSIFGRSVTNESFITINLDDDSIFRNLRIMTFRKNLGSFFVKSENINEEIINIIDRENKKNKVNLVVIEVSSNTISEELEKYLINLNKKVLIITKNKIKFTNNFIYREENLEEHRLLYFNNDIQYGAKFILKRANYIFFSLFLLILF